MPEIPHPNDRLSGFDQRMPRSSLGWGCSGGLIAVENEWRTNALRLAVDWGVWCRSTREAPVERFDFLTLQGWEWTRFDGAIAAA